MSITRVDDRSSTISFAGGWGRGGAMIDYNGSVSYATVGGQTATLSFRGTGVSVYGHIMALSPGVPPPVSTYSIDGGAPTTYNEVQDETEHPNQQFYQSPVLPNGQHTIVLTYVYNNHAALFLDYFQIVVGSDPPPPPPPSPTPTQTPIVTTVASPPVSPRSSSSTGSPSALSSVIGSSGAPRSVSMSTSMVNGTIVTVTVIPSGSPSESNSLSSPPSSTMASNTNSTSSNLKINTGIIIGSCIGGVVTIVLSAIFVYCCLRRRRRNEYDWRKVSGFSNQPYTSGWHQQAGRLQGKVSRSHTTTATSQDHSSISGRPPSYSQEPPLYHPPLTPSSSTQSPLPSKLAGLY